MLFKYFTNLSPEDKDIASQLKHVMPEARLAVDAKIRAKAKMFQLTAMDNQRYKIISIKQVGKSMFKNFTLAKSLATLSIIVLVGVSSTVGVVKADESRPGDSLFGIDKLLEETQLLFTPGSDAQLKLKISIATERLSELALLTGELNSDDSNDNDGNDDDNATTTEIIDGNEIKNNTVSSTNQNATATIPAHNFVNISLQNAINQALAEVDGAITRVKKHAVKLNAKTDKEKNSDNNQRHSFIGEVDDLGNSEDILIKKLEVKAKNNRFEFKIKTMTDKKSDADKKLEKNDDNSRWRNATSTSSAIEPDQVKKYKPEDDKDYDYARWRDATSTRVLGADATDNDPATSTAKSYEEDDDRKDRDEENDH